MFIETKEFPSELIGSMDCWLKKVGVNESVLQGRKLLTTTSSLSVL